LTEWIEPGPARIYTFTIIQEQPERAGAGPLHRVPALIEFPASDGIRLLAAIVGTPLTDIRIGVEVTLGWSKAGNAMVPVFSVPSG
jgi:uncharacterized OB-fold protein